MESLIGKTKFKKSFLDRVLMRKACRPRRHESKVEDFKHVFVLLGKLLLLPALRLLLLLVLLFLLPRLLVMARRLLRQLLLPLLLLLLLLLRLLLLLGTRRGKNPPEHDTHVLQGLKALARAVNFSGGEILYRPVFGSKFGSKNEAMQDFVASFLFRSSATAEVLHVQLTTPIVKCEPAWKLRKINVALMFNHKRSHPRALAACSIMSIMMFVMLLILSLLSRYYGLYVCCIVIIIMVLLRQFGS